VIPHKLQLRNFMCYGEDVPPLHFDGLHVACLVGQNGAGKSTLLDALTWALWGEARAKSDDDLIRLGREEMQVVLEFLLDDHTYRVDRRRKRGKRQGTTLLEFQVQDADGSWRRLTGDTIADTQRAIDAALKIQYTTFINSAFLVQGRADEFTGRKPAERKQVLADILGLADYEALERRAKDRANQIDKQRDLLQATIERLGIDVALRDEYAQRLHEAQERVATIDDERATYEGMLEELRMEAEELRRVREQRNQLALAIEQQDAEHGELLKEIAQTEQTIAQFEATIAQRKAIEQGVADLAAARMALDELNERREQAYELKAEVDRWKAVLDQIRQGLAIEQRSAKDQLDRIDGLVARRAVVQQQRDEIAGQVAALQQWQADLAQLRSDESDLTVQQADVLDLQRQASEFQREIDLQRNSLIAAQQEQQRKIEELQGVVDGLPLLHRQLAKLHADLDRFAALDTDLLRQRTEHTALVQRQSDLKATYESVTSEGKRVGEKLQLVERGDHDCPVCGSPLGPTELARLTEQYHAERDELRVQIRSIKQEQSEVVAAIAEQAQAIEQAEQALRGRVQVAAQQARLQQQQQQAQEAQARLVEAARTLAMLNQQLDRRDYAQAEQFRLRDVQAQLASIGDLATIRRELDRLRQTIAANERQISQHAALQQQAARLDAELQAIEDAVVERPAIHERYVALTEQIEGELYGPAERAAMNEVKERGKALGYSKEEHRAQQELVAALSDWEQAGRELQHAQSLIERERVQLDRDRRQLSRIAGEMATRRQQIAELDLRLHDQQQLGQRLVEAERHAHQLTAQSQQAHADLGRAETRLRECEARAQELAVAQTQATALAEEWAVYDELAQAFGKKGVQAMLIETAIPELEHEANQLLSRMTDNQFHLAFETQRDTRRGDNTIETLDIRISDGAGTRDYQMFSGGEAFRVNFAIRIALSKLLARRAGASLKTLIIDEGFGSQDAQGRDRLVEAINSIESEFERILVITHIQELKDLFQSQIEITKTPDGSTWSVV
jgi:DNA repair protein SbcC/Rad50